MRICIPTETDASKAAKVCAHFGSAPYFTIYDTDKDTFEIISNANQHHEHGTCNPMAALNRKQVDMVVCCGMGARAVQRLAKQGIKVYKVAALMVEEVIAQYKHGRLKEITIEEACSRHTCH